MNDWLILVEKYTTPGARDKFEDICGTLFKKIHPNKNTRLVKVNHGDGGIDVLIGRIGIEPINVIQCKFFPNEFGDSQKAQVRASFKTAIKSEEYEMCKWALCVCCKLDLKGHKWWENWKGKTTKAYNLTSDFIELIDGDNLIDSLKKHDLYNTAFEKEDSIKLEQIHNHLIPKTTLGQLESCIQKASLFLHNVKNYFGKESTTHIERNETKNIIDWVKIDLEPKHKNILILEGNKGLGKSAILKDVYDNLNKEGYLVLGIKADKYYASTPKELENKIFIDKRGY